MREWAQDLTLRKTLAGSNADKSDQVEEWPSLEERSKASASPQESQVAKIWKGLVLENLFWAHSVVALVAYPWFAP